MYVGMTRGRHSNHTYVATHTTTAEQHEPQFPQTMQGVLETVLEQDGIERSAHEIMRNQLDWTSSTKQPSKPPPPSSPPYAEPNTEVDVPTTIRQAVTQSSLNNANDLAAVLHARIEPQIAQRADWLAKDVESGREPWQRTIVELVDRPGESSQIFRDVAAYRELYRVRSLEVLGSPPAPDAHAQLRQHARLSTALEQDPPQELRTVPDAHLATDFETSRDYV
ncbi:hypothetical protein ACGFIF_29290 [Kribbella sp. NPDC049174]|uniref:hypothetical protein n=1 Tax=Kribbella sp. NPDC049174 TaxID=3364112 RepID=UPI00371CE2A8